MQISKTNKWSCMAAAFSMALGIPFAEFIRLIGHDGSDQPYEDKSFYRGFHIQECIDICLQLGVACTEIQAYYGSTPFFSSKESVPIYSLKVCEIRFEKYLRRFSGVLTGQVERVTGPYSFIQVGHAVAWDGHLIHDPRGYSYPFEDSMKHNFQPQTLWMLTKME